MSSSPIIRATHDDESPKASPSPEVYQEMFVAMNRRIEEISSHVTSMSHNVNSLFKAIKQLHSELDENLSIHNLLIVRGLMEALNLNEDQLNERYDTWAKISNNLKEN